MWNVSHVLQLLIAVNEYVSPTKTKLYLHYLM